MCDVKGHAHREESTNSFRLIMPFAQPHQTF